MLALGLRLLDNVDKLPSFTGLRLCPLGSFDLIACVRLL